MRIIRASGRTFQTAFPPHGGAAGGAVSDRPVFNGATDTLLHQDDFTSYTNATAMGASGSPSPRRFAPQSSPIVDGGTVDTTACQILSGGPTGKFFRLTYAPSTGVQQSNSLYLLSPPTIDPLVNLFASWQMRLTATASLSGHTFAVKFAESTYGSHDRVQWSTHTSDPWDNSAHTSHGTYWQMYHNSGFTDELSAFPTGHDQATQPFGPYFNDMCDGVTWWLITIGCRDHSTAGKTDGYGRFWVDDTKIMEQSRAQVGQTPAGGEKQWVGSDSVDNIFVNGAGQTRSEFRIGNVSTSLVGTPGVSLDITDFLYWTRP